MKRLAVLAVLVVAVVPGVLANISDYKNVKPLSPTSSSGNPSIAKAQPIILENDGGSTTGTGNVSINFSNVNGVDDIAVYPANNDTDPLDYEVEKLDTSAGTGVIWVYNNWTRDNTTQARLAYGNNTANTDRQDVTATWNNAGQDTRLITHLNESSGQTTDSSPNNFDSTGTTGTDFNIDGQFDGGRRFDGSDDRIQFAGAGGDYQQDWFYTSYIKADDLTSTQNMFGLDDVDGNTRNIRLMTSQQNSGAIELVIYSGSSENYARIPASDLSTNKWYHVAAYYDHSDTEAKIYLDGKLKDTTNTGVQSSTGPDIVYGYYHTSGGSQNYYDGELDATRIFRTGIKDSDWIEADYDASPKAGQTFFYQESSKKVTENVTIKAEDAFDQSSISNFSANLVGQSTGTIYDLNTTTGTITTPVLDNSSELWDVNVTADDANNDFFNNVNVSQKTTITASIEDGLTDFDTNTLVKGKTVPGSFNVTINGVTTLVNTSDPIPTPDTDFNATFSQTTSDFYNTTLTDINPTCGTLSCDKAQSTSATFNPYNAKVNVTLDDKQTGNDVQNFTATIQAKNYTYTVTDNTTTGNVTLNAEQNTSFNVTVDSEDYPETTKNVTPNSSVFNVSFSLLEERTAQLTFKDTTGNDKITQQVNYTLTPTNIDSPVVSGDTTTGYVNETLLEPASYRGQAEASGFEPNTFFFTIRDESINGKTVYLTDENKTSPITVTVLDQATNPVSSVKVRLQRFYTNTSSYNTITASQTDSEGQTTLFPPADRAYYKFTFNRDGDLLKITDPLQLLKANYQFSISLGETELTESAFYEEFSSILSYDNTTQDFKAVIDQSGENRKVCLVVERTGSLRTQEINRTCTTSTTATLLAPRDARNVTYTGSIRYEVKSNLGTSLVIDKELTKSFSDIPAQATGLIAQIVLVLLVGIPSVAILPTLSPVIIASTVGLGYWMGLTTIGVPAVMAILVTGVVATIAARTR